MEEDDGACRIGDLFVSDLHVSTRIYQDVPMEGDAEFGLQQAVDLALERRVERFHMTGDVLDKSKNQSRPVAALSRVMEELATAEIAVITMNSPSCRNHQRRRV
ncbi:MAG TPA: hypothetical protein VGN57_10775 [Pirellulaceae bacterium]|nr:hypothetical protein [Pirellulaceae bacterium]